MPSNLVYHTYTGVWRDNTQDYFNGLVWTVHSRQFTAIGILLGFAIILGASMWWKIFARGLLCFLDWLRRLLQQEETFFFRQRQLILATTDPFNTARTLLIMPFPWAHPFRDPWPDRPTCWRLIPLGILAFIFWAGTTASSVLVYRIETDNFKLNDPDCGFIFFLPESVDAQLGYRKSAVDDALSAKAYAVGCYGSDSQDCSSFIPKTLPYSVAASPCPFFEENPDQGLCRATALQMNTGFLDSAKYLGINAPPSDRVLFRKRTTCAPIETKTLRQDYGGALVFNMGPAGGQPYTYNYQKSAVDDSIGYQLG